MTLLPAIALAMSVVYMLNKLISEYFSDNVTAVIDLLLFVVIMAATNSFLKNLRGD